MLDKTVAVISVLMFFFALLYVCIAGVILR